MIGYHLGAADVCSNEVTQDYVPCSHDDNTLKITADNVPLPGQCPPDAIEVATQTTGAHTNVIAECLHTTGVSTNQVADNGVETATHIRHADTCVITADEIALNKIVR